MNIEELTKSQIFLLTLLTSFVTSMATGIVAFSLMDQGPTTITQSVSRVIQATIEKTPQPDKKTQPVAAAVAVPLQTTSSSSKEPTLSEIVQAAAPSLVRLYDTGGAGSFLGFGVVLDAEGTIVADYGIFGSVKKTATVVLADGTSFKLSVFASDPKNSLIFLAGVSTSTKPYTPIALAKASPAIGQSIVGISGKTSPRIAPGLIVALSSPDLSGTSLISTDIASSQLGSGVPIIDMNGALVGISTSVSRLTDQAAFTPASVIGAEYTLALQTKAAAASEALTR